MNKKWITASLVLLTSAISLSSCSNRAIYETVQMNQLRRCEEIPIPQQANCREQFQTSFDEYTRGRNELKEEAQQ